MILDYKKLDDLSRYKVMSASVVPRPIAWIVTEDEGILNAAPFSYFIPLSSNPATIVVSIGVKEDDTPKDTLANILKTKKATICFANENNLEKLKLTATSLDKNESEIEKYEIEVKKILDDFPPMISSSKSALFCTFHSRLSLGGDTTPLILEIQQQFVCDECINEKNHINLDNIGRVGVSFAKIVKI
jgi:flavin reductase (DIM6/NTAB) family NADH-FMN oxidoreductase RutF